MNHIESSIIIYFTKEYKIFNNISGNRFLVPGKIDKIKADITSGLDMLRYCPIIVDKNMNVIDGQHRLQVARELKCSVWYVIVENEKSLHDIAKINSNTDKWRQADFLNSYVILKNPHYLELAAFIDEYKIPISVAMKLLYNGSMTDAGPSSDLKDAFQRGQFTIKFKDRATEIMEMVMRFKSRPFYRNRLFIIAITKLIDGKKCDMEFLIDKYNQNPDELKAQSDPKAYLINLEEIYNHRAKVRKVIY